ncbi:MAG: inner-membrane translocator [Planctomyces sp.]|nr:inner-membrane translocator [Planctomyces sp.]
MSSKETKPSPSESTTEPGALRRFFRRIDFSKGLAQFGVLVLIMLFFSVAEWLVTGRTSFSTSFNIIMMASQASTIAIAALGMTIIIIAGGIDLSVGTAIALCGTVCAWFLREDYGAAVAIPLTLLTGVVCGAVNGMLISFLRVVPFIITLGTMSLFLGIGKLLSGSTTVRPDESSQVPHWLSNFATTSADTTILGLPPGVWTLLAIAVLTYLFLRYSVFSRYIFALGSNESTARLCGINIPLTKIALYALAGFFVGLAGMYQFSELSEGSPTDGVGLELKVIAAVVIGGGSLNGGRGTVQGTLIGSYLIFVIDNGCTKIGLPNHLTDITLGVIIITAVAIDQWRQRRLERS